MPEGDTIFRSARALHRALSGKQVTGFRSAYANLTRFHDNTPLTGQTVVKVEARGKWLLMHFSSGSILVTHMLMNGSWHIYRHGDRWQNSSANMRVVVETAEFIAVGFSVPIAEMHTASTIARDRRIPPEHSDVLGSDFDAPSAAARLLSYPNEELGNVLLFQKVLAGVGNVFKSEICFATGLHPLRLVGTLSEQDAENLVAVARRQLSSNILEDSPDTIITYRGVGRRTTRQSDPAANLWVYGRRGQPCRRCETLIEGRMQGMDARITYWCPQCQPMPSDGRLRG